MMTIFDLFELLGIGTDYTDPWSHISNLIHNSTFSSEIKEEMDGFNNDQTPPEVMEIMLKQLYENQIDRIDSGLGYNQTDIIKKINRINKDDL